MKIKINRFCLRHQNKVYKRGSIVEIEDEAMARNIVAHSDGDFSFYHPEDEGVLAGRNNEREDHETPSQEGTSGTQETDTGEGTDEENDNGLPDPDFEGAVTK